jgi:ubiquinone/menaquinone biosynthesis C-methylase UbiE
MDASIDGGYPPAPEIHLMDPRREKNMPAGRLIGLLMAIGSLEMNRFAVEALDLQPDDRLLEIGFGPGTAIRMAAGKVTRGIVVGVDPSREMVRQASRRSRRSIETGRVLLREGGVSHLPFEGGRFTKVLSVNSLHHWPSPASDLLEVRRVMAAGGLLVLGLRLKHPTRTSFVSPGYTEDAILGVEALLKRLGFEEVGQIRRRLGREVVCVTGRR